MLLIPDTLARNVVAAWGVEGAAWLAALPDLLGEVASAWELELGAPFRLTYHWVMPVRRADGAPAVLKLGPPGPGQVAMEAALLARYAGHGAVRLFAHDPDRGALLLERADPGTPATALVPARDVAATAAIITVMRRLHQAMPVDAVPSLVERDGASFTEYLLAHRDDRPLPRRLVERAAELHSALSGSAARTVLLHGDLHHDNLLRAKREPWLAIDPHGVRGDPGYEVGAMLYNPDPDRRDPALLALVQGRLEQLADGLAMPLQRLRAWGFVQAVLSEVWTVEGGGTPGSRALDVALLLEPQLD